MLYTVRFIFKMIKLDLLRALTCVPDARSQCCTTVDPFHCIGSATLLSRGIFTNTLWKNTRNACLSALSLVFGATVKKTLWNNLNLLFLWKTKITFLDWFEFVSKATSNQFICADQITIHVTFGSFVLSFCQNPAQGYPTPDSQASGDFFSFFLTNYFRRSPFSVVEDSTKSRRHFKENAKNYSPEVMAISQHGHKSILETTSNLNTFFIRIITKPLKNLSTVVVKQGFLPQQQLIKHTRDSLSTVWDRLVRGGPTDSTLWGVKLNCIMWVFIHHSRYMSNTRLGLVGPNVLPFAV